MNKEKNKLLIFLLPSFIGFNLFYLIPFLFSFYHTIVNKKGEKIYIGISAYIDLFNNEIFMRGVKNSIIFIGVSVPLSIALSLFVAMGIKYLDKWKAVLQCIVLIPLVIPSASVGFFWKMFFSLNGLFNNIVMILGGEKTDWLQSAYILWIMIFVFIWKNIGYNTILFSAGLYNISKGYYESAMIDGANSVAMFRHITIPFLIPTVGLVTIMSIVNSFKVFKEIYVIAGAYPNEKIYMVQHYMNNMFMSLDYQKLSTSAYILVCFIVILLTVLSVVQRRYSNETASH